jgi:hypothetical protein
MRRFFFPILALAFAVPALAAGPAIPHLRRDGTATQLIVDGRPFLVLAGEVHNSSSSSLAYMESLWPKLVALNLNTVLVPVSWEMVEPQEGRFDFAVVDGLIRQARDRNVRLVLLWFATWKNGVASYAPPWVKQDVARFPRVKRPEGINQRSLSAFGEETMKADARAFAALMRHLKQVDGDRHTVVMMQVQNEAGLKNYARDHHPLAEAAWNGPVPQPLLDYMKKHRETLIQEFREVWEAAGAGTGGTWAEVFGASPRGEEIFQGWHVARYIGKVAEAGRREYDLPMFANAWLIGPGQKPGQYPTGGPHARLMDVWRVAAPAIDLLAPDIYLPDFKGICESYTRQGNPLLIPETRTGPEAAARAFFVFAEHDAIGFAPFGVDHMPEDHPLAASYDLLRSLAPLVAKYQGTDEMAGLLHEGNEEEKQVIEFSDYKAHVRFPKRGRNDEAGAYGLIIEEAPDRFLLAGHGFDVHFGYKERANSGMLEVWEGTFDADGGWVPGRRLNGDETGGGYRAQLPPNYRNTFERPMRPRILRVHVYHYPWE